MNQIDDRLEGKRIAIGVTGSIASVESVKLIRELRRHGASVTAFITKAASEIIHPNALQFATGKPVIEELTGSLEHLTPYDLMIIAPATANTVAKISLGIADNPVTSLALAMKDRLLIVPAMHLEMMENPTYLGNIERLSELAFIEHPDTSEGAAKMAPIERILERTFHMLSEKDLDQKKILITAGPTFEAIDPVRGITNRSSGKMGIAIAKEAFYRGGDVTLIYGPGIEKPPFNVKTIPVESASEMMDEVRKQVKVDVFIGTAAVADYRVIRSERKLRSGQRLSLELIPTEKVLSSINGLDTVKIAFKAGYNEDDADLAEMARDIIKKENCAFVVANDVSRDIFGSNTTEAVIVKPDEIIRTGRISKEELAARILDEVKFL